MSRCTPYIEVRVLTENYDKNKPSKINNVAFMRFTKEIQDKTFKLDESIGFGELMPHNSSMKDDERKAMENIDVSFMDIFTAPQTFSNANINSDKNFGKLKNVFNNLSNKDDVILEPIMPFLSLQNLTVSITGAGYGIMASKRASMDLILHNRS